MASSQTEPVTPKGRRTREALLDAGELVADRAGLAGLSVAAVVKQAGLAKGTFYVYFADRDAFVDALHQRFYARVSAAVTAAVEGLGPGQELLLSAIEAYLDVCLENHAVKALVFDSRTQGSLTTTMRQREEMFAQLAQPSLRAMGIAPAPIAARLLVAMTSEAALIELEAGRRVPGARRAIGDLTKASAVG
jgi:TetR/AcrR family transcriptional regulator, transcriptional repressor for nem operon